MELGGVEANGAGFFFGMRSYQRGGCHINTKQKQVKLNLMDALAAVRRDNFLPHQAMQLLSQLG